mgnify:FL=1
MSNALLNEETLQMDSPIEEPKGLRARRDRLPSSEEFITIRGVARVTRLLFALLLIGGFIGWAITEVSPVYVSLPGWYIPAVLAGLVLCFASYMKPSFARILAPIYAVVEGLLLGSITKLYEYSFDGIALQAALLTVGVFGTMLWLYSTRIVKVTGKMRRFIFGATFAIMGVYLFQILMSLVGVDFQVPFLHDSGPFGIVISLVIVGIASMHYLLDFDLIEKAVEAKAPKEVEWLAGFGLLLTTIWVYLEILRLLAKIRSND